MRDVVLCALVFASPSLTELEINFQPFLSQSAPLIPAGFLFFFFHFFFIYLFIFLGGFVVSIVVTRARPCNRSTTGSVAPVSRAEFTLSSLASPRVILCCHFSWLQDVRYVRVLWRVFPPQHWHVEYFVVSLVKASELVSVRWSVVAVLSTWCTPLY